MIVSLYLLIKLYLVFIVQLNLMTLYCNSMMVTGMICAACIGIPAVHYTLLNHLFIYDGCPHETLPCPQSSWSGICNWFALFLHRHSKLCPGCCSPSCELAPASHINFIMLNRQLQRSWFHPATELYFSHTGTAPYPCISHCIALSHCMQCLTLHYTTYRLCVTLLSVVVALSPWQLALHSSCLSAARAWEPLLITVQCCPLPQPDNGTFLMPRFPSINLSFFVPW